MTRCRVGDLAVMTHSVRGNEGQIVEVLRYLGTRAFKRGAVYDDVWLVRGRMSCEQARLEGGDGAVPDAWLRPIRPGEGEDETIRWAGLPREIAHA